jgi:hypothetical protein
MRAPSLWALITFNCVTSVLAICLSYRTDLYTALLRCTLFLHWIFEALTVIAAFRALTKAFPRVEYSVTLLLGALGIVGTCAVWMAGFIKMPLGWSTRTGLSFALERDTGFIMAVILVGSRGTIAMMGIPTRKSARRFCDLMIFYMLGGSLAMAFTIVTTRHIVLRTLLPIYKGAIFAGLSAFWLFRASDRDEDLLPLVWTPAIERPKAELLQMEGREEISRLLGPDVDLRDNERSRRASGASA